MSIENEIICEDGKTARLTNVSQAHKCPQCHKTIALKNKTVVLYLAQVTFTDGRRAMCKCGGCKSFIEIEL